MSRLPEITTQTIEVKGVRLPFVRKRNYDPDRGRVLENGEVFVSLETLQKLADSHETDYLQTLTPLVLSAQVRLALSQADLVQEQAGYVYGTDRLRRWMERLVAA